MKNLFSLLFIVMLSSAGCSGPSSNQAGNDTHVHADGTVHSDSDGHVHDSGDQETPHGQESFKVEGAEAQHDHEEHEHTEACEEHGHKH